MNTVDVVVPCYRYAHFVRECVESVLAQRGVAVRVLIIDDASPDHTAEIATELSFSHPQVTFIRHAVNKGHIATYNEGIEWTSATYYMILSADDFLLPGALARATDPMEQYPEVGLTYGRAIKLDQSKPPIHQVTDSDASGWRIIPGLEFITLSGARNIVPTPTAVVRTALQKKLGGYCAELPHTGDMEMWLRIAAHSAVCQLESYQAIYRRHNDNMSLRYRVNNWLPDLQQRRAALNYFFTLCKDALPRAEERQRRCSWLLASDAVSFASWAFNNGQAEVSNMLSRFAVDVCPGIRTSMGWAKLQSKRCLGAANWQLLQSARARFRSAEPASEPLV